MLRKEDHTKIGQLHKAYGIGGDFNVSFLNSYRPEEFIDVVLVEYDNYLVPFFVEDFSLKADNSGRIKFDHINKIEETVSFVNCSLYAPNNHHISVDFIPDASSLVDYTIQDEKGQNLGVVIDFIDNSNNPLLEIETDNGNFLMPLAEEYFKKVDAENQLVVVNLPEGLITLNE